VHGCTSGVLASILCAYSGWAAPELNRIPIQHQVTSFIRDGKVLVKSVPASPRLLFYARLGT